MIPLPVSVFVTFISLFYISAMLLSNIPYLSERPLQAVLYGLVSAVIGLFIVGQIINWSNPV